MGTWVVSAEDIVGEQRSDPSLAWLVPQQGFWSDDEVGEPPFLFGFSVLIFWVFFFTFLNGSSLAGAPARLLSDDEVLILTFSVFLDALGIKRQQDMVNPTQCCIPITQVLVQTPKKNFTVTNLSEFFMAYEEPNFAMMVEVNDKKIIKFLIYFVAKCCLLRTQKGCFKGCHPQRLKSFVPMGVRLVDYHHL